MAPSSSVKHDIATPDKNNNMTTSTQKTRRTTKKPRAAPSAESTNSHPYLQSKEVYAIEHWTDSIPTKSKAAPAVPDDPVIQAYMQAKMALFKNSTVRPRKSNSSLSTSLSTSPGQ